MGKLYATKNPEISERELRNMNRSRKIAAQGMVLLENDGTLPLKASGGKIALYGDGARFTIKGGTGSGDVNSRFVVNVEQGLEDAGFTITTKAWLNRYDKAVADARDNFTAEVKAMLDESDGEEPRRVFWKLFNNPFKEPVIVPVTKEDMDSSDTDTAVYILSRKSGEGKDRRNVDGEYVLFEEERIAIKELAEYYDKFIVVLNVGGVIDTKFLRGLEGINAIVLMSQAGNIGGYALADVLIGQENPSGRLSATWAKDYFDYPGAGNFSHMNGDIDDEYYSEGIYVGYRYFDTFGITPAYPFGYGLSYTTFDVRTEKVVLEKSTVNITVNVKNTGSKYAGRQVVQVYYSAPDGKLEKPYQELIAFGKTKELQPGEEDTLLLTFKVEDMASYDTETASKILEAGTYYVRVGVDSRTTDVVAALTLDKETVIEKLNNYFAMDCDMKLLSKTGASSYTYEAENSQKESAPVLVINTDELSYIEVDYHEEYKEIPKPDCNKVITVDDVKAGYNTLDELVGQLTVEEMAGFCVGTARGGFGAASVVGAASLTPGAAGDTAGILEKDRNIRSMVLADGPAGLRLSKRFMVDNQGNPIQGSGDAPAPGVELLYERYPKAPIPEDAVAYYQYCTAIPIATLLAQTWDLDAIMEAGDIVGEEMNELGISLWLAPGMNIHRNPLCGRNFEYFSEDPFLTGMCAVADTLGVQKHDGVGTTIKHFAFNNQEDNRMHVNAHIDERTIREIYLKCFEIAVKRAQPMSIMTSYNLINGIHTANSKELLDYVARDEWGFKGLVMTDWGTTGSLDPTRTQNPNKYSYSSPAGCIKAGNDLIMPGSQFDVDEIIKSIGATEGEVESPITLADLQMCTKRIIDITMQSYAYEDAVPYKVAADLKL